jgi:hypothetical protein
MQRLQRSKTHLLTGFLAAGIIAVTLAAYPQTEPLTPDVRVALDRISADSRGHLSFIASDDVECHMYLTN